MEGGVVSCGGSPRQVNLERPGEPGRWVLPPTRPVGASGCRHASQSINILGIVGGPVGRECLRCGDIQYPTWVPDEAHLALPPAPAAATGAATHRVWPFMVGEAEWADLLRERGAA
jgi:hypothetical protein